MTEKVPNYVWNNDAVTLLLSLYLCEKQKDRPVKLKKKEIWKNICTELWSRGLQCSWQECDKKYRNLKQTFVRNLKQAGRKECRWLFFPIMLEINKHEPFVNEMVSNAFAHNIGSSNTNTSASDYEDNDASCSDYNEGSVKKETHSDTYDTTNLSDVCTSPKKDFPAMHYKTSSPNSSFLFSIPHNSPESASSTFHQNNYSNKMITRYSRSPSPQRQPSPDYNMPSNLTAKTLLHYNQFNHSNGNDDDREDGPPQNKRIKTSTDFDEPPDWFRLFLLEYKKSEDKKLQQIKDLCDEVRRTNDIEHQRNMILNEKNDLLKNLMNYMNRNN